MTAWKRLAELASGSSTRSLEARQMTWLLACLSRNATSAFGLEHGFAGIDSLASYQNSVPTCSYDDVRGTIQRIASGAPDLLFCGAPVAFERTGGSSGGGKLIPYSAHSLLDFRRALLCWLHDAITGHALHEGCAYWALSPATRSAEVTPAGIPVGLPDGAYFGPDAGEMFCSLSAVPFALASETDVAVWQRETLYWLLRRADLALISVWSPSFFSSLLDALPQHAEALLARLSNDDADSARRLEHWLHDGKTQALWPRLRLVSCWADASSRPHFDDLRERLPHAFFQPKGLLSTEAVVTIPDAADRPLLAADCGFYEFLDDGGTVQPAWMLRPNERYEVVLTTAGGLYRYRTGDSVLCSGNVDELPELRFIGRGSQTSDLVGEKLTDDFVADCLAEIPGFHLLLPCARPASYVLVHDGRHAPNLQQIEELLHRNPQYAYARRIGQLQPLTEKIVPDALSRYQAHAIARGQRIGDIKLPALCLNTDWLAQELRML